MAKGMSFEKEDKKWEITGYTDCAYTSPNIGTVSYTHLDVYKRQNVSCPMQVDEATMLNKLTIESDKVLYHYTIDESVVQMLSLIHIYY